MHARFKSCYSQLPLTASHISLYSDDRADRLKKLPVDVHDTALSFLIATLSKISSPLVSPFGASLHWKPRHNSLYDWLCFLRFWVASLPQCLPDADGCRPHASVTIYPLSPLCRAMMCLARRFSFPDFMRHYHNGYFFLVFARAKLARDARRHSLMTRQSSLRTSF